MHKSYHNGKHSFPRKTELRQQWMEVCGLNQDEDVSHIRLCSKHFKSSDYIDINAKSLGGRLSLKDGSIPSVKVPYPKPNIQSSKTFINRIILHNIIIYF